MTMSKRRDNAPSENPLERSFDASETSTLLGRDAEERRATDDENDGLNTASAWRGLEDFEGLPWWRTPSVNWLLGPFALFTLAFGGIIVPKVNLILDLVCQKYFADQALLDPSFPFTPVILGTDNPQCRIPEVQSNVATFMLVMNFIVGGLSAIVAPKLGRLSDRYGRCRLLALASCGGLLGEMVTILAAKFPETVDYRWLILGSVFDGMTGSFTAGSILSQSYTSDCTPPSKRAVSIGYLHACLFTGLAFGPLLAGFFVKWTGSLISIFYVVLGCHAVFILFVGFVVPESVSSKKKQLATVKWEREKEDRFNNPGLGRRSNPFAALSILWPTGPGTSRKLRINMIALAISDTIILGTSMAVGQVIIIYSKYIFDWGNFETSIFISSVSMVRVVVLMGIFPVINYFGRIRPAARQLRETGVAPVESNMGADRLDIWILRIALVSDILGSVGYLVSRSEALFFASGMVTALGGLGSATVQAVVTKHVPAGRVGQVLGAIGMLHALARVIGPVLFNGLYSRTVGTFPQAFFVLLLSMFVFGLVATFAVKPGIHWEEDRHEEEEDEVDAPQGAAMVTGTMAILAAD